MAGDAVLAWVLGGLLAAAWGLSGNRRRFRALIELTIWALLWLGAAVLFFVALLVVAR